MRKLCAGNLVCVADGRASRGKRHTVVCDRWSGGTVTRGFLIVTSVWVSLMYSGGAQVVAYTILDIISKVVFSFMIVSAHDSLGSSSQPQVQSREYV